MNTIPFFSTYLHSIQKKWQDERFHLIFATLLCIVFALIYSVIVMHKYWQFEYFFVDNVYFHTGLWKLSQFQEPIVLHQTQGAMHIFGDHFHPTIMLVALLFRLIPSHLTILLSMPVLYSIGGFFAFLIGRKLGISKLLLHALLLAYFLYIATQHAFMFGFHEINLMPTFFFITVWAALEKKWSIYWIFFALLLLTKESMPVVGVALAFFLWFVDKSHRNTSYLTAAISLGWFYAVTEHIIPYFSGGFHLYTDISLPDSVSVLMDRLTNPPEKINTFLVSIGSFGFLPLLSIATLPLVMQDFFIRYVMSIPVSMQYLLMYHYGVALAPMLLMASIWSAKAVSQLKYSKHLMYIFVLSTLLGTFYGNILLPQRAPILLFFNPSFYEITEKNAFLWKLIEATPDTGSVMTQNHLGLALSQRDWTHMLAKNYDEFEDISPDYLVYDLREGQNPNNYFPSTEEKWRALTEKMLAENLYQIYFEDETLFILEKVY